MLNDRNIAIIGKSGEWSALPVVRELGAKGYNCYCIFQQNNVVRHSRYIKGFYKISKLSSRQDLDKLVKILLHKRISRIICLHEDIKQILIENRDKIKNFKFLHPARESFCRAINKSKAISLSANLGIPTPKTFALPRFEAINDFEVTEGKVLVTKGTRGVSSQNVRYSRNFEQLKENFYHIYESQKSYNVGESLPIIQEYVGGPTYLTQAIVQNGVVKVVIPHIKYREWPVSGGISCRARTIYEPRLVNYMTLILEELEWHGEVGMEWKYDKETDDYYFIEINPRFEGSLDLAVKSGVDMLGMIIDIMDDKSVSGGIQYRVDVDYRWFFRSDFRSFLRKPDHLINYIAETFNPRVNGELQIDDLAVLKGFWKRPFQDIIEKLRNS